MNSMPTPPTTTSSTISGSIAKANDHFPDISDEEAASSGAIIDAHHDDDGNDDNHQVARIELTRMPKSKSTSKNSRNNDDNREEEAVSLITASSTTNRNNEPNNPNPNKTKRGKNRPRRRQVALLRDEIYQQNSLPLSVGRLVVSVVLIVLAIAFLVMARFMTAKIHDNSTANYYDYKTKFHHSSPLLPEYPYPLEVPPPPPTNVGLLSKEWTLQGGGRFAEYTNGTSPYRITVELRQTSDTVARGRRDYIKASFQHAWAGYSVYAYGMDELQPVSRTGNNRWGGFATTMIDSLDTLWLMDMKDEFYRARDDYLIQHLKHKKSQDVIVFETCIRSLGGLLSAHDWSFDNNNNNNNNRDEGSFFFLDQALMLAQRLFPAFDSQTGIPFDRVNLQTGEAHNEDGSSTAILARLGTLQLEYRWLDYFLLARDNNRNNNNNNNNNNINNNTMSSQNMRLAAEHVYQVLHNMKPLHGLYPTLVYNNRSTIPSFVGSNVTFGGGADSFYEYLLKVWIQGGQTEGMYRDMYDTAIQGLHDYLLQTSEPSGLMYLADMTSARAGGKQFVHEMQHLACFAGGMLALGAYTDPLGLDSERAQRDLTTARGLTYTCYQMYARTETGISPEVVRFEKGEDMQLTGNKEYILRPEVVESFYVLHSITGDPVYREWGWEVYQAIERFCKTEIAYGALSDVSQPTLHPTDSMESFFLAETLKYLYLLFDPDSSVDILETHVFNTEAHPIRRFSKI